MSDKIRFTPVRGTTEAISAIEYTEGNLYFDVSTGDIWLDSNEQRIPMGSGGGSSTGSGVIIGNRTISVDEEEISDITFVVNDLNIDYLPGIDAIILNVPDGCFYRVISKESNSIVATRLTVAGGGGGTAEEPTLSISIDSATLDSNATLVQGQPYEVAVTGTAINGNTDTQVSLNFDFADSNGYHESFTVSGVRSGRPYRLDLSFLPVSSGITMTVSVDSDNANMRKLPSTKKTNIKVVDMHVDKAQGYDFIPVQTGTLQLRYIPYGKGLNVQLHTAVDGEEFDNGITLINDNMEAMQTVGIPKQPHGTHQISVWLSATVNRTVLSSTPIIYEASWADETEEAPLIWVGDIPAVTVQYESLTIPYMVYSTVNERIGATTTVDFYKSGTQVGSEEVRYSSGGWRYWDVTTLYEVGENEFTISCGSTTKRVTFNITTEGSRDLALVNQSALVMNFDSMGRSSTEIASTRGVWASKVGEYKANLLNFNWYNNGWVDDKDGFGSYLSIANGASVTIPFGNIAMNSGASQWTFEMRFRVKNAHKYATLVTEIPKYVYTYLDEYGVRVQCDSGEEKTLEQINALPAAMEAQVLLDEDGNMVMNEANTTEKIVETSNNVIFKYLNGNNEGFCIGTQEAYFNTAGKTVNVRYKEGEIINITFVIDKPNDTLSIYLNGILSGAVNLTGIGVITMENIPFLINSEYCDFDLYKFRVYNIALTMPEVIHNYLADIKDIALYDENQLTDVNDATKLSYTKLVQYNLDHPDDLTMPYVLIDSSGTPNDDELPHFKGGNKKVSVTFVNPAADKLLDDKEITEFNYYTHCPSFTADNVDLNVQGTSSQKYPRRNFKAKFGKAKNWVFTKGSLAGELINGVPYEKDGKTKYKDRTLEDGTILSKKWHMDNEFLGTDKFTWKIDYMESSGSYNTGFANLMGNNIYSKHPLDDLGYDASSKNYRTSVYGFPFLAFHKRADGSITYIGRYNMNLDKGSNEYYGFEEGFDHPYVPGKTIAEVAECWELRDNQGTWCSFRYPTDEARTLGFMTPTSDSTTANPKIEVAQHFEARYHLEADAIETAQGYTTMDGEDNYTDIIGGTTNAAICAYLNNKLSNLKVLFDWLDSTDTAHPHPEVIFDTPITMEVTARSDDATVTYEEREVNGTPKLFGTFTADTIEYRRQKFRNEFEQHLDLHYCTIYFIMTELLLCYDSRGKNMMIATFGPRAEGGQYIWYPIFYDIDTQLGLNNVGALLWDYDEDNSENKTFSTGDSVLWTNFYDMFRSEIISTYSGLRKTKVTYDTIEGAYTCNPKVFTDSYAMRGKRPIVAIGLDEYYKYVLPVTERWKQQDGTYGTANYLYACQGDRILSRELLINNRLLYMDSKWHSGDFTVQKTMNSVTFRVSGNDPAKTSDKYLDNPTHAENQVEATYPVPYYDATPIYKVTPYLNFYITWFTDENSFPNSEPYDADKYPNGMDTIVSPAVLEGFRSGTVDEQLNYFPGANYISSFGDLSTKYLTQVSLPQGEKLLDITLGNDAPEYFNNKMKVTDFDLGTGANSNEKGLLQKIILSHLRSLDTFIDASNPKKLREFRALDTPIKYVLFADGAPLSIVHLPNTVTRLKFIENKNLTKILTEAPIVADMVDGALVYRNEDTYSGLYVQGLTDYKSANAGTGSAITEIEFEGDALGYGSYTILKNAVALKTLPEGSSGTPGRLSIRMDSINWTPYKVVDYGEPKQTGVDYYYLTDHSTYIPYTRNSWTADTLNGKVFTFDATAPKSTISDLSLLDQFIADYEKGIDTSTINQFTNNNEAMATTATVPTITGNLFVANADGTGIDEDKLTNVYNVYWPNLSIRAEKINESYIAKFVQVLDSGREEEIDVKRFGPSEFEGQSPTLTNKIPSKTNYTFTGWALDAAGTQMVYDYDLYTQTLNPGAYVNSAAFRFSETNNVITLYAIFIKKQHGIKYYNEGQLIVLDSSNPQYLVTGLNQREQVTMLASYGDTLPIMPIVPSKDSSDLPLLGAYVFKGWSLTNGGEPATNLDTKTVTSDLVYYAIYEEYDDIHEAGATDSKYFTITSDGLISVASGIKLSGKIVIPNVVNGITVTGIDGSSVANNPPSSNAGFFNQDNITHVFLQDPLTSQCKLFKYYCFSLSARDDNDPLVYVELPETGGVQIQDVAFYGRGTFLSNIPINYVRGFFERITSIGSQGFADIRQGFTEGIYLPSSITKLGNNAFYRARWNKTCSLEIGSQENPVDYSLIDIGSDNNVFAQAGINQVTIYSVNSKEDWMDVINNKFKLSSLTEENVDGLFNL